MGFWTGLDKYGAWVVGSAEQIREQLDAKHADDHARDLAERLADVANEYSNVGSVDSRERLRSLLITMTEALPRQSEGAE